MRRRIVMVLTAAAMMAVMVSATAATAMASPLQNFNPASTFTVEGSTLRHEVFSPITGQTLETNFTPTDPCRQNVAQDRLSNPTCSTD